MTRREALSGLSEEVVAPKTRLAIINETDSRNPLCPPGAPVNVYEGMRGERDFDGNHSFDKFPSTTGGFVHNPEGQRRMAQFILDTFRLPSRGPVLEVGVGQNSHPAQVFVDAGVPVTTLDGREDPRWRTLNMGDPTEPLWHAPKRERTVDEKGLVAYSGDLRHLSRGDSDLRSSKFGLVMFNGSWNSEAINFTITNTYRMRALEYAREQLAEAQKRAQQVNKARGYSYVDQPTFRRPDIATTVSEGIDESLQICKDHLVTNGLVGIVSSRYAFHGEGFRFNALPEEKLGFLDLYLRFRDLGAKRVTVAGVSQGHFRDATEEALKKARLRGDGQIFLYYVIEKTLHRLRTIKYLADGTPTGDNAILDLLGLDQTRTQAVIQATSKNRSLNSLARIDAIFAEF